MFGNDLLGNYRNALLFFLISLTTHLFCEPNRIVLVTGGAGYIGSHTCKALNDAGFIPVSYDSLIFGTKESVKWGPLVVGDVLDVEALDLAFSQYKPCAVLHFAALRNVGESVHDPANYYTNNVVGSINLLNALLKHHVEYIIFSSSCSVYGNCPVSPIPEEYPKAPTNPYSASKLIVENIIKDYGRAHQLKYTILRYFNAAGVENESGLKRSLHSCNFLIPRAMLSLIHSNHPLEVFGSDYLTPDGTCIRDYIHVKDLANAHVLALRYLLEGGESDDFNLGTGKGYSVLEVIQAIEEITERKVPYKLKSRREGDVPQAIAKVDKARDILGFKAYFSDLQTMIKSEWVSILEAIK